MKQYGNSRDMKIINALEEFRYMTTTQIAELFFTSIKNEEQRRKKASERLKKLHDRGFCYRMRLPGEGYIYTTKQGGFNHKVEHFLNIVDIYIFLLKNKPAGSSIYAEVEKKVSSNIITDLYVEYRNEFRKESRNYYFEIELNSSGSLQEKVYKYIEYLEEKEDLGQDILCIVYRRAKKIEYSTLVEIRQYLLEDFSNLWKW